MKPIRRLLFLLTFIPMFVFQLMMVVLWLPLSMGFLLVSMARYVAIGKFLDYGDFFMSVICWPWEVHSNLTEHDFFYPDMDEDEFGDSDYDDCDYANEDESVDYDYEEYEE